MNLGKIANIMNTEFKNNNIKQSVRRAIFNTYLKQSFERFRKIQKIFYFAKYKK